MSCLPNADCLRIFSGESPIKVWREYLGLSVAQLSDESRVHSYTIQRAENGNKKPDDRTLRKLATAMGLHPLALKAPSPIGRCCDHA